MVWYEVQRTLKSFSRAPEARLYTQSVAARYEKLFPIFALHSNQRPRLGYMDLAGKTVIAPRFSSGLEFLEGRACPGRQEMAFHQRQRRMGLRGRVWERRKILGGSSPGASSPLSGRLGGELPERGQSNNDGRRP